MWMEKELTVHCETHSSSSIKNKNEGLRERLDSYRVCWLDFSKGIRFLPFGAEEHYFLIGRPFQNAIQNVSNDLWEKTFPWKHYFGVLSQK